MGRKVLLACDDSPHSRIMVDIAFQQTIHHSTDEIHLAMVLPPGSAAGTGWQYPMAPMASAMAVSAVQHSSERRRSAELNDTKVTLKAVSELIAVDYKVPRDNIHMHVLPSEGGASGVSEAVVHLAQRLPADFVVVGSRGMGAIKRSLMSLVGLGSVSDAVLSSAPCPVVVVRWDPSREAPPQSAEANPSPPGPVPKRVCVAIDESGAASTALSWALNNVLQPHDQLHVASVAMVVPCPVLDEPAAVAAMQMRSAEEQRETAMAAASRLVEDAVEHAASTGVTRTKMVHAVLSPSGGASDAGSALTMYAKEKNIDMMVVGSRGLGAVQRSIMSFMGLGSVSSYLAHHVPCALAVVRNISEDGRSLSSDLARASEGIAFKELELATVQNRVLKTSATVGALWLGDIMACVGQCKEDE